MNRILLGAAALCLAALAAVAQVSTSRNIGVSVLDSTPVSGNQTIASVSLSSNSFTGGAADSTMIGAITVTMSPASPAFSGTLTLTGTQTGSGNDKDSFKVASSNLQTNTAGGATDQPGTYAINIVATQGGISNSPFSQSETISASGTGGAGWQLAFSDEFSDPNGMLENLSTVSASAFTWANSVCSGIGASTAGCGTLTVASLPSGISSAACSGSNLGACYISISGATNGGAGGDAAVNGTFLVTDAPSSTSIKLYMPYSGINTTLGGTITAGSGPWVVALTSSCSSGPCTGLPLLGSNDNTGESEGWDPHACAISGGNLVMNIRSTNNYVPPVAMKVAGNGYTFSSCHIQTWNGSSGNTQAQESYMDAYGEIPNGSFHTSWWALDSSNVWNSGPEIDQPECFSVSGCQWHTFQSGGIDQSLSSGNDYSAALHQFGVDLAASGTGFACTSGHPECFFLDGVQDATSPGVAVTAWYPMLDVTIDSAVSGSPTPATLTWSYIRMYKKVASGACYSSIPGHATIPHTGTC